MHAYVVIRAGHAACCRGSILAPTATPPARKSSNFAWSRCKLSLPCPLARKPAPLPPTPPPQPSCHYLSRLLVPFPSFLTPWVHVLCPTLRVQHKSTNTHTREHTHTRKCTAHRPGLLPRSAGARTPVPNRQANERVSAYVRARELVCGRGPQRARRPPSTPTVRETCVFGTCPISYGARIFCINPYSARAFCTSPII